VAKTSGGGVNRRFGDSQTRFAGGRVSVSKLQVGDVVFMPGTRPGARGGSVGTQIQKLSAATVRGGFSKFTRRDLVGGYVQRGSRVLRIGS
jgi:hypothetical protein